MTRGKVNLAYIENDAERKSCFKKRTGGLMKKVSELSTLCGVETCAVVYGPYEQEPIIWPSREGALSSIDRFNQVHEMDRTRKMFDQEDFIRERIKKLKEKVSRLNQENKIKEMEIYMYQCIVEQRSIQDLSFEDACTMEHVVGQTTRNIVSCLDANGIGNTSASDSAMVGPSTFAYGSPVPAENFTDSPFPPSG